MTVYFVDSAGNNYANSITNNYGDYYAEYYFLDGNDTIFYYGYHAQIYLGSGNDYLSISTDMDGYAYGDDGNDTIYGTLQNANRLFGGNGSDQLNGGPSSDRLFGGGWDDTLSGGEGSDVLYGDESGDALYGGGGGDTLYGGDGNDTLNGGGGVDRMSGDDGDDQYEVTEKGDRVLEHAGDGYDTIWTRISYTMPDNVEALFTFEDDDIKLTGNGASNDMRGGGGDNTLIGGRGKDTLNGWNGKDTLDGGRGKDVYFFNYMGPDNVDKVVSFKAKDDDFWLQRDGLFTDINDGPGLVRLTKDQFHASESGKAADKQDRILYDTDNGKMYYDPDGTGHHDRVLFGIVDKHPALTYSDFLIW